MKICELSEKEAENDGKKNQIIIAASLAETAVFRFKTIFSDKLRSRKIANQFNEMAFKCACLNRMTPLGMPDSNKAAA
jgi:hypothetical protein